MSAKIEQGNSGFFKINGVPYQRGAYEPVVDKTFTKLGLRRIGTQGVAHDYLVEPLPANEWIDANDNPYANIQNLLTDLETFFFQVTEGGNPANLATYRAQNWTDLTTNVATNPQQGETAYVVNPEGTQWLPGSLGGSYYPRGLYLYDGTQWISDKQEIAAQLQINVDDIEAIELVNQNQDNAIANNASNISANSIAIANNTSNIILNSNSIAQEISDRENADNVLQQNIDNEETARQNADNSLAGAISQEVTDRQNADNTLQQNIDNESTQRENGDQGSVTIHNDVNNAGSGEIITNQERLDINGSVGVHDDVELINAISFANSVLKWDGNDFIPTLKQIYVNPLLIINNTNVLTDVINVQVNIQRLVPHKIIVSFGWSLNDQGQDFVAVASLAGENLVTGLTDNSEIHRQEPKDTGGADPDGRGTNQRHRFTGVFFITPNSLGNNQLLLQHSGGANGDLASIWNTSIEIEEYVQIN